MNDRFGLLPPPTLQEIHLRAESVEAPGIGPLEALVPAGAPYVCTDPNKPAMVLIPGLGMDGLGFLRQLPLGRHFHLNFFQTPNQPAPGQSGLHCYAHYVEEYILARRLDQTPGGLVLGGCSMGGALSLAIATRGRVKLRGLVLIGTFGSCRHLPWWQRKAAPLAWVIPMRLMRMFSWQVVARTKFFGAVGRDEADWLVSCKIKRTQKYFGTAVAALTTQEQIAAARTLRVPTLILHGTDDRVLPYAAGQELHEAIPGSKLVTIKDSGHALFFTDHQPCNEAIADFAMSLK